MVHVWVFSWLVFFLFEAIFCWSCPSNPWPACQAVIQNRGSVFMALRINWEDSAVGVRLIWELLLQADWYFPIRISGGNGYRLLRSSSAISEPNEVWFSEELPNVRLLWCCHWQWMLKAEVCELLSGGLSCSLELLWLKSVLDKVFLDGGGEGRTLCAMDYKISVLRSTDLSATSLLVAKSEIAEPLPKPCFKVSWSVHSRSK